MAAIVDRVTAPPSTPEAKRGHCIYVCARAGPIGLGDHRSQTARYVQVLTQGWLRPREIRGI
jgi:hypothetical protein